jgi:hypothetical protein
MTSNYIGTSPTKYAGYIQVWVGLGPVGFGVDFVLLVDLGWAQYMA